MKAILAPGSAVCSSMLGTRASAKRCQAKPAGPAREVSYRGG